MLNFKQCTLRRGTKVLFEDASFTIHHGQKVGITGVNGCGKSSLFALILGKLHPDAGDFEMPSNLSIAHVAQETPALTKSALDYVVDGDSELRQIEARLAEAEEKNDGVQIARHHASLETIDGYMANNRAARLLSGLSFSVEQQSSPVSSFSGGWRMRLNLAQALMCRSDILLLDEPTNHLDLDAVIWLQQWLATYPGTLLLISHDRDVLDDVTTHIARIEQQRVELFSGNYSEFERRRAEILSQQQVAYERQQKEIAHVQKFIDRFRAQATKARQAQSRIKTLERMEKITAAHVDSPFSFTFLTPEKMPGQLLSIEKVDAGYGDKPILSGVNLHIANGDRIALLGTNGSGKSTLIKLLAGTLAPISGEIVQAQDLKIGYFAQHQLEQLIPEHSPLQHLLAIDPKATEQSLRDFLGGFAFRGDMASDAIAPFSGGEKARLALALRVYQRPNLLLLDEPTNHLDLEMRHALSLALQDFEGALVVISHDRHLLRSVSDKLLLVRGGGVVDYDGDLDDYRKYIFTQNKLDAPVDEQTSSDNSSLARKDKKRLEAEQRKRQKPLRDKVKKLEQQLERLNQQKTEIDTQLADATIYEEGNKKQLTELLQQQAKMIPELNKVEEEWMELSEQLEG